MIYNFHCSSLSDMNVTENDSDDFFQSKHIVKRFADREEKKTIIFSKIQNGLESIKTSYANELWDNEDEKIFLEIFSEFHLSNEPKAVYTYSGWCIVSKSNNYRCFYDCVSDTLFVQYYLIILPLKDVLNATIDRVYSLVREMICKYFNLCSVNVTPSGVMFNL